MLRRQRGATFLGMVVILAIVGFALYGGIRLTPVYLEYMAVARALQQTADEYNGDTANVNALRSSLDRRWIIEDIHSISVKEIDIKRTANGFAMRADYRAEAPFVANVSLAVDFDKTVNVD